MSGSYSVKTARSKIFLLGINRDQIILIIGLLLAMGFFLIALILPLYYMLKLSLFNMDGQFIGLNNFIQYLDSTSPLTAIGNTLIIGLSTTLFVGVLAFSYAYAITRTCMPFAGLFKTIGMLPILMPSLLSAISLVYWFGNQGVAKALLFGNTIYGAIGIILGLSFWCFPHAMIILCTAFSGSDARLYEAANVLKCSPLTTFIKVTLPGVKYGLISALIAVFTLAICDFGVAKVIGGQFNVLATDIYKQIIGQQNFSQGAITSLMLLLPAILTFVIDYLLRRKQQEQSNIRAVPYQPKPNKWVDSIAFLWCSVWALLILAMAGMAIYGSLIQFWPYNLSLTLDHYLFDARSLYGWLPFINSLKMSLGAAIFGTILIFLFAYFSEKGRGFNRLRTTIHAFSMLSMAVPGIVLGIGYIFFFNQSSNPLNGLYGTMWLLILCCIGHYYTVGHLTAINALKKIPKELELVAMSLKIPLYKAFFKVSFPVCLPAILDIFTYIFVNSMTTTSAVIFIYNSDTILASISVLNMDETGDTASAAAMAVMILLTSAFVKGLQVILSKKWLDRTQRWQRKGDNLSPVNPPRY
ncbi:MAG: putative 2-aminoethylphosphonate ABC transporter permease subunit [Enterobacteriaceae bacterium]|nr:putative 2-aminoethylphosphonate ABC transporter permease subunit [Enterobacteriaceae bacterium]